MDSLIKIAEDSKEVISSLEIAEITGREHKNVMRDIRKMLEQLDNETRSILSWLITWVLKVKRAPVMQ